MNKVNGIAPARTTARGAAEGSRHATGSRVTATETPTRTFPLARARRAASEASLRPSPGSFRGEGPARSARERASAVEGGGARVYLSGEWPRTDPPIFIALPRDNPVTRTLAAALLGLSLAAQAAHAQAPRITERGDPSVRDDTLYRLAVKASDYPD